MSRYHDEFGPGINQQCLLLHCTSAGKSHPYIDSLPELFPDLLSQDKYEQILKTKTTHVDMLYCCGLSRTRISNYFDFDIYDLVSYPYHRWFCTLRKCTFRKKNERKKKKLTPSDCLLFDDGLKCILFLTIPFLGLEHVSWALGDKWEFP